MMQRAGQPTSTKAARLRPAPCNVRAGTDRQYKIDLCHQLRVECYRLVGLRRRTPDVYESISIRRFWFTPLGRSLSSNTIGIFSESVGGLSFSYVKQWVALF